MSGRPGSNRPPRPWQGRALPNELLPLNAFRFTHFSSLYLLNINKLLSKSPTPFLGSTNVKKFRLKQKKAEKIVDKSIMLSITDFPTKHMNLARSSYDALQKIDEK